MILIRYAIKWTNIVINDWDPTNFTEFYEANIDRVIGDGVISPDCCLYDRKLVASLIDSMGGPIEFADKINRIKRLQINFVQLDAVKQWHKFIDWSGEDLKLFILNSYGNTRLKLFKYKWLYCP